MINTEGTIVTLTTGEQIPGTKYTVIADGDELGLKQNQVSDVQADFVGFQDNDVPPQIDTITSLSSYLVEASFSNALKPTSIASDGSDFEIFTAEGEAIDLKINTAEIIDQYTILVSTDIQRSNEKYRLRVFNIESAAGRPVKKSGLTGLFKGYQALIHSSAELEVRADFNGDGRVDFTDFTMFSAVYGEVFAEMMSGETETINENTLENIPFE